MTFSETMQRFQLFLIIVALVLPVQLQAERVKLTKGNLSQFSSVASRGRYVCRSNSNGSVQLGKLKKGKLRPGAVWRSVSSTALLARLNRLEARVAALESRGKSGRKLNRLKRKVARQQSRVNQIQQNEFLCIHQGGSSANEFIGNALSLAPYRESLSENEITHILEKVAFGGSEELRQIAKDRGLSALVDALVDGIMSPAENAQLDSDAAHWYQMAYYYPDDNPGYGRIWTTNALQIGQLYRSVYSRDPFHEWLVYLWSTHFATNLNAIDFSFSEYGHYGLPLHWYLLRQHAAGNWENLLQGLFLDPAMNVWLDNKDNRADSPNQNFARELLELFSLGAIDPVNGSANYDEESIVATTAFVSGYYETNQADPETGQEVIDIGYNNGLHDQNSYTVFRGIPGAEFTGTLNPEQLLHHVLYRHPGAARYLGERVGGQMLYPGLPEGIVAELAQTLRSNSFELKPLFKKILRSSALFSVEARTSCVASPVEYFLKIARRTFPRSLPREGEMEERSFYTLNSLFSIAANAGQSLFEPPSVFGWKGSCNINRAGTIAHGEGWVSAQRILNRLRGCVQLMNHLNWIEYDFVEELELNSEMSAVEIVRQIAQKIHQTRLESEEERILVRLLTEERDDDGSSYSTEIRLAEEWYTRRKIPRLICLVGDLAELNLR